MYIIFLFKVYLGYAVGGNFFFPKKRLVKSPEVFISLEKTDLNTSYHHFYTPDFLNFLQKKRPLKSFNEVDQLWISKQCKIILKVSQKVFVKQKDKIKKSFSNLHKIAYSAAEEEFGWVEEPQMECENALTFLYQVADVFNKFAFDELEFFQNDFDITRKSVLVYNLKKHADHLCSSQKIYIYRDLDRLIRMWISDPFLNKIYLSSLNSTRVSFIFNVFEKKLDLHFEYSLLLSDLKYSGFPLEPFLLSVWRSLDSLNLCELGVCYPFDGVVRLNAFEKHSVTHFIQEMNLPLKSLYQLSAAQKSLFFNTPFELKKWDFQQRKRFLYKLLTAIQRFLYEPTEVDLCMENISFSIYEGQVLPVIGGYHLVRSSFDKKRNLVTTQMSLDLNKNYRIIYQASYIVANILLSDTELLELPLPVLIKKIRKLLTKKNPDSKIWSVLYGLLQPSVNQSIDILDEFSQLFDLLER